LHNRFYYQSRRGLPTKNELERRKVTGYRPTNVAIKP
jgi:hypothetical protein